ncbi:MAG: hypothetical protein J6V47_07675 [Bacteroidaceae bacterium]|jgi:hypothetical protein|nr:hypothetical protein [Bacteroidaceae bacterium]
MSKFSKAMRATNTVASLLIAIGVAVDLYEKFKGRKKTLAPVVFTDPATPVNEQTDDTAGSEQPKTSTM